MQLLIVDESNKRDTMNRMIPLLSYSLFAYLHQKTYEECNKTSVVVFILFSSLLIGCLVGHAGYSSPPRDGICSPALEALSLNHRTAREVPAVFVSSSIVFPAHKCNME